MTAPKPDVILFGRSKRSQIRNPVLSLPSAREILDLSPDARRALGLLLREITIDARLKAEKSWLRRKGPLAHYWRAVQINAKHLARVCDPSFGPVQVHIFDTSQGTGRPSPAGLTSETPCGNTPALPPIPGGGAYGRSALAEVRNPILALPSAGRVLAMASGHRRSLGSLLRAAAAEANIQAEECWRQQRSSLAAYWRAASIYAKHLARAIDPRTTAAPARRKQSGPLMRPALPQSHSFALPQQAAGARLPLPLLAETMPI